MSRARILIVEDEAIVAQDLSEMLAELGYTVLGIANTASRAVELAVVFRPDLVLMDIRLEGGSDGISAAATIRERLDTPVVFLTAYADDVTVERAKTAEPFGYLVKPVMERELNSAIQIACHRRELERDARNPPLYGVLEDLGGGYYRLDHAWRFVEISPGAERLFGARSQDLLGREIWEIFPELQDSAMGEELRGVAENGQDNVVEILHLPARLRVRMYVRPGATDITVFFFATYSDG